MKKQSVVLIFLTATLLMAQNAVVRTGVDVNSSYQVTATHLASPLPIAQGGTAGATQSAAQAALGLGTAATQATGTFAQVANNLSDLASAATARTNLGISNPVTASNCSSAASPAVCAAASAGSIAFPTGVTSVAITVNTTAVTANSQIFVFSDDSLGAKLGVTCNSTLATLVGGMAITSRSTGASFQITYNGTIATNPLCASFLIVN